MIVKTPLVALCTLVAFSGTAWAQCAPGTRLNQTQLSSTFSGNTLCAQRGSDRWQEQHRTGGELWDYKLGADHQMDPTKKVGTWEISGTGANAVLVHTYGATSFSWEVCGPVGVGTGYTLVSTGAAGTISGAEVKSGSTSCP
jgi:hypothetical protein